MPLLASLIDALESVDAPAALRELDERRELTLILPELEEGRGFRQPELHHYTVLDPILARAGGG
ncbi:MAG: hypothetical protein WEC33_08485, partial [Dehalococcoidia bacterium]